MNLIEKFHALLVSEDVRIWHYPTKEEPPRFFYWTADEPEADGEIGGHGFDTLGAMIEAAYARIDPMLKPAPADCPVPDRAIDYLADELDAERGRREDAEDRLRSMAAKYQDAIAEVVRLRSEAKKAASTMGGLVSLLGWRGSRS